MGMCMHHSLLHPELQSAHYACADKVLKRPHPADNDGEGNAEEGTAGERQGDAAEAQGTTAGAGQKNKTGGKPAAQAKEKAAGGRKSKRCRAGTLQLGLDKAALEWATTDVRQH